MSRNNSTIDLTPIRISFPKPGKEEMQKIMVLREMLERVCSSIRVDIAASTIYIDNVHLDDLGIVQAAIGRLLG
jgi:hypothetical protein